MRMHATLVDPTRYVARDTFGNERCQASVGADGRWIASAFSTERRQTHRDGSEYLCDDHTFLGRVDEFDWGLHVRSRSHPEKQATARWWPVNPTPRPSETINASPSPESPSCSW